MNASAKFHKHSRGLSLLELLVVLCLVGILYAFGLPVTRDWYQRRRCVVIVQDIQQAIQQAAAEALTRGEPMRLMPLSAGMPWSLGMMLIPERTMDLPETMRFRWQWPPSDYTVLWHGFVSQNFIRIVPDLHHAVANGYFLVENSAHHGIKLIINRLGSLRSEAF